jgi:hypothetical protein
MDLNFGHAMLAQYFATSRRHDTSHWEDEKGTLSPVVSGQRHAWMTAMRQWSGTRLIRLGERIGEMDIAEAAESVVTS